MYDNEVLCEQNQYCAHAAVSQRPVSQKATRQTACRDVEPLVPTFVVFGAARESVYWCVKWW